MISLSTLDYTAVENMSWLFNMRDGLSRLGSFQLLRMSIAEQVHTFAGGTVSSFSCIMISFYVPFERRPSPRQSLSTLKFTHPFEPFQTQPLSKHCSILRLGAYYDRPSNTTFPNARSDRHRTHPTSGDATL